MPLRTSLMSKLSLKEVGQFLLLGGATLSILFFTFIFNFFSVHEQSYWKISVYSVGSILALMLYQPHFIATYRLNYFRGAGFLKEYWITFIFLPLIFVFLIITLFFDNSFYTIFFREELCKSLLFMVIIGTIWHFSAQSIACICYFSEAELNPFFKRKLRVAFFVTGIYGVLNFVRHHFNSYRLFNLSIDDIYISHMFLKCFFIALVLTNTLLLFYAYRNSIGFKSYIPWLAYLAWYMSDTFTISYFYLIPIMHTLQFLTFYLIKTSSQKKFHSHIGLILLSLVLIYALPNMIHVTHGGKSPYIFEVILICINLHHFAMERVTWKGMKRI